MLRWTVLRVLTDRPQLGPRHWPAAGIVMHNTMMVARSSFIKYPFQAVERTSSINSLMSSSSQSRRSQQMSQASCRAS